jgi:hypothetical protein
MGGLQSMARELGVSETQAASGAAALVPAILGGFKKQAQSQPAGLEELGGLLGQLGGGGATTQEARTASSKGNGLGQHGVQDLPQGRGSLVWQDEGRQVDDGR